MDLKGAGLNIDTTVATAVIRDHVDPSLSVVEIQPLHGGHTVCELLSLLVDDTPRGGWQIARDTFHTQGGGRGGSRCRAM